MILVCPICNKEFNCSPSRYNKAKYPPTCSTQCASQYKKSMGLNCTCDFCGKKFHKKPSHFTKYNYCSTECLGRHRQIIYQGENNPNAFCRIHKYNRIKHCGYYWLYIPDHPFASSKGYIREHRYIAEQYLLTEENSVKINNVRYLSPKFDVHHIDFNKLNNEVDNLLILTRSEHKKLHWVLNKQAQNL